MVKLINAKWFFFAQSLKILKLIERSFDSLELILKFVFLLKKQQIIIIKICSKN